MSSSLEKQLPQLSALWQAFTSQPLYGWSEAAPITLDGRLSSTALQIASGVGRIQVQEQAWLVARLKKARPAFFLGSLDPGGNAFQMLSLLVSWLDQMLEMQQAHDHLNEELSAAWNRLNFLFELNHVANQGGDFAIIFQRLAQFLLQLLVAGDALLVLQDESGVHSYTASGRLLEADIRLVELAASTPRTVTLTPGDEGLDWLESVLPGVQRLALVSMPLDPPARGALCLVNPPSAGLNTGDEQLLQSSAEQITILINNLQRRGLQEANRHMEHELRIAGQIQKNFLPKRLPVLENVDFAASLHPAQRVGGDFYDIQPVPGGVAILLGDVAGKGISAALLAAMLHAALKSEAQHHHEPAELLQAINHLIFEELERSESFITAFLAVIRSQPLELTWASAGHPPALLWHAANQEILSLVGSGLPLGITPQSTYTQQQHALHPGDMLYLYSDGVTETLNAEGRVLGMEAMSDLLLALHPLPAAQQLRHLQAAVELHRGSQPLHDDLTLFLARVPAPELAGCYQRGFVYSADRHAVRSLARLARQAASGLDFPNITRRVVFLNDLELAVSEIAANIVMHAYQGGPGRIQGHIHSQADRIWLEVVDNGIEFTPPSEGGGLSGDRVDLAAPAGELAASGYGLSIAQHLLDICQYRRLPGGRNHWTLEKRLPE